MLKLVLLLFLLNVGIRCVPTHNLTTLKLLQIIHTHGDRTPSHFVSNDPFANVRLFWPEGIGQLNRLGRNRMFRIGQFFAATYNEFLAKRDVELEQFIYAQSSAYRRCLESAAFLFAGFLGGDEQSPDDTTTSNYDHLREYWQPLAIKSSSPKGYDRLLDDTFPCPNADLEWKETEHFDKRIQRLYVENGFFLDQISNYTGERIHSLKSINELYQELLIESQYDLHWWKKPFWIWSDDYEAFAISKLREITKIFWSIKWSNRVIQRLLVGKLVQSLSSNIKSYINGTNRSQQLFVYSTHDSKIAMMLHALNILGDNLIPPGASIMLELHQHPVASLSHSLDGYYLRLFYLNETYSNAWAYELTSQLPCSFHAPNVCSVRDLLNRMSIIEPDDLEYECGNRSSNREYQILNLLLLATNCLLAFTAVSLYLSRKCGLCDSILG